MFRFGGLARTISLLIATAGVNSTLAQGTYTIDAGGLESFNVTIDGTTYSDALAGGIQLNYVSGTGSSFASVCTDVSGTLYLGYNYSYSAPTGFTGQHGLDPSWGAAGATPSIKAANELAAVNAAADLFYKFGGILGNPSTMQSVLDAKAGLQLAVWAALYNTVAGTDSVSLDGSRFSAALPTDSTTWNGGWGKTYVGTSFALTDAMNDLSQINFSDSYSGNLLIPSPTSQWGETAQEVFVNVTPVPEASTLIAGGLLLLPFLAGSLRAWRRPALAKRMSARVS